MRQKLVSITQRFRLPAVCLLCKQYHRDGLVICSACTQMMPQLIFPCSICATPLPDPHYPICGQCIKSPPAFDRAIIGYAFEDPLRTLLHQFKYHQGLYLRSFLAHLMLSAWKEEYAQTQCLIPVPLHPKKLAARGFNQAAILSKILAKKLGIPYDLNCCHKIKNTLPQASLDKAQREANLKGSFYCITKSYKHITLIDDLLTTGSTAQELAVTLKDAGVEHVDIWCCARTLGHPF